MLPRAEEFHRGDPGCSPAGHQVGLTQQDLVERLLVDPHHLGADRQGRHGLDQTVLEPVPQSARQPRVDHRTGMPSPRSRRSRPSCSSTAATAGLVAPVGTDPQCITGVTRDRTRAGNHLRSRKTRVGARVRRGPPVTWGGHGRRRHGGVPGHRQQEAGASGMSVAFGVVFGLFVVAIVALAVIAIRWAVLRDRLARAKQAEFRTTTTEAPSGAGVAPGPPPRSAPRDDAGNGAARRRVHGARTGPAPRRCRQLLALARPLSPRPGAAAPRPHRARLRRGRGPGLGPGRHAPSSRGPGHHGRRRVRRIGGCHQRGGVLRSTHSRRDRHHGRAVAGHQAGGHLPSGTLPDAVALLPTTRVGPSRRRHPQGHRVRPAFRTSRRQSDPPRNRGHVPHRRAHAVVLRGTRGRAHPGLGGPPCPPTLRSPSTARRSSTAAWWTTCPSGGPSPKARSASSCCCAGPFATHRTGIAAPSREC